MIDGEFRRQMSISTVARQGRLLGWVELRVHTHHWTEGRRVERDAGLGAERYRKAPLTDRPDAAD